MTYENIPPVYRYEDLKKQFNLSRSSLDRWEKSGDFPKRIRLGANSIAWRSEDVQRWLQERSNTKQEPK